MTKTIFEEMGGTYRQVGDYLLPNITVPAEEEIEPIGASGSVQLFAGPADFPAGFSSGFRYRYGTDSLGTH